MDTIKSILALSKRFTIKDDGIKEALVNAILRTTKIDVQKKNITYRQGVLYIKSKPIEKSEILLNKEKILKEIQKPFPRVIDIH